MSPKKRERVKVDLEPSVVEEISRGEENKRPRYPSEEGRVNATWLLNPDLVERIRVLSRELRVSQYKLVETLLSYSLNQYESGKLPLRVEPIIERFTVELGEK